MSQADANGSNNEPAHHSGLSYDVFEIPADVTSLTLADAVEAKLEAVEGFLDALAGSDPQEMPGVSKMALGMRVAVEEAQMMLKVLHDRRFAFERQEG